MLEKFAKGNIIKIGNNKIEVVSELMKFKNCYAIYADVIENIDWKHICSVLRLTDEIALIIRNKEKLLKMGLNAQERKAIYCHELGHCFSLKQKNTSSNNAQNYRIKIIKVCAVFWY